MNKNPGSAFYFKFYTINFPEYFKDNPYIETYYSLSLF